MRCEIRTLPLVALGIVLAAGLTACDFSLTASTIPNVSSANGAVISTGPAGSTVVIRGAGFGDAQGAGRLYFTPVGGGVPLSATIASWTQAAIVGTVPGGAPGNYAVNVLSGNGISSGGLLFTVTPALSFIPSAVTWSLGPNLPSAVSGAGVAFAQTETGRYVYVVGGAGAGGAPLATVSYAVVASDGTLGTWLPATSLPLPRAFAAAVAATKRNSYMTTDGFLYVVGGTSDASGTPVNTVYRAPLLADGSLGAWTSITALPSPLRSVGAVIQYGSVYVAGGATTGNTPVATVYRSAIQTSGVSPALTWLQQGALPGARARFAFGASGVYLYAFGGDSIAVAPNDTTGGAKRLDQVVYAKMNPSTGEITTWSTATAMANARSGFPAVLASGSVLLAGGLYSGASTHTSEAAYAALNPDGTTSTFTTVAPTTSINSLCGCNLFNDGATGYLDGTGSFHLLVVGGDNVNALGTPRAETFIY